MKSRRGLRTSKGKKTVRLEHVEVCKEKPQKGKVIAVGNGTKDEKMTVSKGDTVLYGKYAGTELKLDGQDYLIMRESDILAIV